MGADRIRRAEQIIRDAEAKGYRAGFIPDGHVLIRYQAGRKERLSIMEVERELDLPNSLLGVHPLGVRVLVLD